MTKYKATLSKNYKFIQLNFEVERAETFGLAVYSLCGTETTEPIAHTDLVAGKKRYYLNKLPKEFRETIHGLEIKQENTWFTVILKNNNL